MNKSYVIYYPRPTGVEPTVYLSLPNIDEDETGAYIINFTSIVYAIIFILEFNSHPEYLKHFKFKL